MPIIQRAGEQWSFMAFCIRKRAQAEDEQSSIFHFSEAPFSFFRIFLFFHSIQGLFRAHSKKPFPNLGLPGEDTTFCPFAPLALHAQNAPAHMRCSIGAQQLEEWFYFIALGLVLNAIETSVFFNPLGRKRGINCIQIKFMFLIRPAH